MKQTSGAVNAQAKRTRTRFASLLTLALALAVTLSACGDKSPANSPSGSPDASPSAQPSETSSSAAGNFSDDMKIPYGRDLSEDGADSVERSGDHLNSPYFSRVDFFNAKSTDSLTILEGFKTQQQTSEWSCGVSAALMVLNWHGKLGEYDEVSLSEFRGQRQGRDGNPTGGAEPGATNLQQMIDIFEGVGGFSVYSTFDCKDSVSDIFTLTYIRETLKAGNPILIGWNDWGGHWQAIIGYDTMGTEYEADDVIIVADPYDTTDHNQDGYGVYGAERFIYNFTFYNFFPEDELNDMCFLVPTSGSSN
ncbi:MAG: hypothetical protein LBC65_04010 [Oscillospiraceae bacterium]|jgi:predicted small lipoprotein YifL|nr:hypothetical protein [Oscillospiraceae bacterium]